MQTVGLPSECDEGRVGGEMISRIPDVPFFVATEDQDQDQGEDQGEDQDSAIRAAPSRMSRKQSRPGSM